MLLLFPILVLLRLVLFLLLLFGIGLFFAFSLSAKNAILLSCFTVNDMLFNSFTPSTVFDMFFTCSISFPGSLSGLKSTYGYFLFDGFISSSCIFSSVFFLDVACFDFEAFALNLAMKSCNSFIFSSFFLFCSLACFSAN